jgi:hypothetical protein
MLSQRHLRQPPQRNQRNAKKYNSNQYSLFHITTLGSRTPHTLDVRTSNKDSKPEFYTRAIPAPPRSVIPSAAARFFFRADVWRVGL